MTASERKTALRHLAYRLSAFGLDFDHGLEILDRQAGPPVRHSRGADLTDLTSESPEVVLSGWACTMQPHETRGRQIFTLVLPGDVLGSFRRPAPFSFWKVCALTPVVTAPLGDLITSPPGGQGRHADVLQAARSAEDHALHLLVDQLGRLGSGDAYSGLAHLLLEIEERLTHVRLAKPGVFQMPIGQRVIAQAMGLSVVHTNHTLQRMIADGLLAMEGDTVRLLARERNGRRRPLHHSGPERGHCQLKCIGACFASARLR